MVMSTAVVKDCHADKDGERTFLAHRKRSYPKKPQKPLRNVKQDVQLCFLICMYIDKCLT